MFTLRDSQRIREQVELVLQSDMIGELCRRGKPVYYIVDGNQVIEGASRHHVAIKYVAAQA